MDRIRKALDLARQDRARLFLDDELIAPPTSPAPARPLTIARKPELTPAPEIVSASEVLAVPVRAPALEIVAAPEITAAQPEITIAQAAVASEKADVERAESAVAAPAAATPAAPPAAAPFAGLVEYTKTRVYTPPPGLLESKRIIDPARIDPAAAAFRMLRTQVLQRMDDKGWRSLAVLSPDAADGKTTTAANLAVSLAYDHRHTVLLVDCDLRQPSIANALGIAPEFGLDDVLTGKARIEQCLYHPEGVERLVILPARAPIPNSSEALSSEQARELVAELRARYAERIVVFDLPPVHWLSCRWSTAPSWSWRNEPPSAKACCGAWS